jgi:hypothetical protein
MHELLAKANLADLECSSFLWRSLLSHNKEFHLSLVLPNRSKQLIFHRMNRMDKGTALIVVFDLDGE